MLLLPNQQVTNPLADFWQCPRDSLGRQLGEVVLGQFQQGITAIPRQLAEFGAGSCDFASGRFELVLKLAVGLDQLLVKDITGGWHRLGRLGSAMKENQFLPKVMPCQSSVRKGVSGKSSLE